LLRAYGQAFYDPVARECLALTHSVNKVRTIIVGTGGMARFHIQMMLKQQDTTEIVALCDPSPQQLALAVELFEKNHLPVPTTGPELEPLLQELRGELDAALIVTPHAYHFKQATACLESGLDVLLEKPMVMNARQARKLIKTTHATGRLLVVAFPGSLSPQIREAKRMLREGQLGVLQSVNGFIWQNWKENTVNTWRQVPKLAGGGFMFDTGAHLLNTTCDLVGEEFVEVAAWLDNRGAPVDIIGTVMAKTKSGVYVTMHGCGEAFNTYASEIIAVGNKGLLRTGIWGERLEVQFGKPRSEGFKTKKIQLPPTLGVWEQFLDVRAGRMENPCPPAVGLRMAKLWDAINASAQQGGKPVTVKG
jgi:predicted dehydrogenase